MAGADLENPAIGATLPSAPPSTRSFPETSEKKCITTSLFKGLFGRTRSRITGSLMRVPLPKLVRTKLFNCLLRKWNADPGELSQSVEEYKSISDFFSRGYKKEARPVESWNPSSLVSPADGKIVHIECIEDPHATVLTQLKGATFKVEAFLGTSLCKRDSIGSSASFNVAEICERVSTVSYCSECGGPFCHEVKSSPRKLLTAWRDAEFGGKSAGPFQKKSKNSFDVMSDGISTAADSFSASSWLYAKTVKDEYDTESHRVKPIWQGTPKKRIKYVGKPETPIATVPGGNDEHFLSGSTSFNSCSTYVCERILQGDCEDCREMERTKVQWFYIVIYLSPQNYHHFHAPADLSIINRKHFVGEVMPVCKSLASKMNDLFAVNERVVLDCRWTHGDLFYGAIAAYNVADIKLTFEPAFATNVSFKIQNQKKGFCDLMYYGERQSSKATTGSILCSKCQNRKLSCTPSSSGRSFQHPDTEERRSHECGVCIRRGAEIGEFKLGSTVVLLFQAPRSFEWAVEVNDSVKVGQVLGSAPVQKPFYSPFTAFPVPGSTPVGTPGSAPDHYFFDMSCEDQNRSRPSEGEDFKRRDSIQSSWS